MTYFLFTQLTTKSLGRSLFKHLLKETLRKSVSILSLRMYVGMYSVVTLTNGDMSQLSTDHISFIGIPWRSTHRSPVVVIADFYFSLKICAAISQTDISITAGDIFFLLKFYNNQSWNCGTVNSSKFANQPHMNTLTIALNASNSRITAVTCCETGNGASH